MRPQRAATAAPLLAALLAVRVARAAAARAVLERLRARAPDAGTLALPRSCSFGAPQRR
jgi:hypothetical protein